jgi:hypothetical protein
MGNVFDLASTIQDANKTSRDELDPNETIIVRYDGCCRWTVSLTRCHDNTRKDCPHYSTYGCSVQEWTSANFKTSDPIEFVTTWKDLMSTVKRYEYEESYHKTICTARECHFSQIENCSKGKGYHRD